MTLKELLDQHELSQAWVARELNVYHRNFRDMVRGSRSFPADVQKTLPHLLREKGITIPPEVMRHIFNQCRPVGRTSKEWHWCKDRQGLGKAEFCVMKGES